MLNKIFAAALLAAPLLVGAQVGGWGSRDRVTPPFPPTLRPEPRAEKLVRLKTRYLLDLYAKGAIPDESEYMIRARTSTLLTAAACLKFAACQEPEDTRAAYAGLLKELARTHHTGGGATASGKPWGHEWQSAFWTWQATFSAWLLWPELGPELREAVLAMAMDEADRFLDLPAPYAQFLDTKAEENAWNSMLPALLAEILESHPHRERWRERALEYMISAFAAPRDRSDGRMIDGRPLSAWLRGANIHADYTLENHGFVHPDYMSCIGLNLTNALVYRLLARRVPDAVTHNAQPVYELLKFFTQADGSLFYPGGTDWSLHRLDLTWSTGVQMDRLTRDRQAGALAELALETMERMCARYGDGRMFGPSEFPTYKTIEAATAASLATGLMFARLWPPVEPREPIGTIWKKLEGGRVFEDGRFFVFRAPKAISSFSWGTRLMGLTVPFTKDPVVWPLHRSYFGLATPIAGDARQPGRFGMGSRAVEDAIRRDELGVQGAIQGEENGAMHVTLRAQQRGRAKAVSFTALPSGRTVYMERYAGDTASAASGMIALSEEPEWVYGRAARTIEREGSQWVNVDDRLGFALSETGSVEVRPDIRSRLLFLNKAPRTGAIAVIVTLPGTSTQGTREFASRPFRLKVRQPGVGAVEVDGLVVVTNLTPHPLTAEIERGNGVVRVPVYGYATRVVPR